ncbi:MAG TPA: MBL fold metallo-hydrolase [Ignavibacteriaceae bacterium]|nr:MBL fold metallo-hydrolase [Ignavibacteriaceae bacterium]
MKITFVGTSSGKASLNRNHSSLLFTSEEYNLLVDAGDGISRALLSSGLHFNSLNGILFTHLHPDHFSGLPALIVQMKMMNRNEPLDIFIHDSLKTVVEDFLLRSYLLPDKMEFKIHYKTFTDDERLIISKDFSFIARKNSHLGNLEKFKGKYPSLSLYSASFLFEAGNKKIVYTSDVGSEEDLLLFRELFPDILISEVTHISPSDIVEKIIKINPSKVYLTHYSDEDIPAISEILANLPSDLKEKVKLAVDNLSFEI